MRGAKNVLECGRFTRHQHIPRRALPLESRDGGDQGAGSGHSSPSPLAFPRPAPPAPSPWALSLARDQVHNKAAHVRRARVQIERVSVYGWVRRQSPIQPARHALGMLSLFLGMNSPRTSDSYRYLYGKPGWQGRSGRRSKLGRDSRLPKIFGSARTRGQELLLEGSSVGQQQAHATLPQGSVYPGRASWMPQCRSLHARRTRWRAVSHPARCHRPAPAGWWQVSGCPCPWCTLPTPSSMPATCWSSRPSRPL